MIAVCEEGGSDEGLLGEKTRHHAGKPFDKVIL